MNWLVLGNGPAITNSRVPASEHNTIVFNHGHLELAGACRVQNQLLSGACAPLLALGPEPFEGFTYKINRLHDKLQSTLNNVPSSGLCCLIALLEASIVVEVADMDMLPSLAREQNTPPRKSKASCYHNWLGERRILHKYNQALSWPQFILNPLAGTKSLQMNPFPSLLSLTEQDKHQAMATMSKLTQVTPNDWLTYANKRDLLASESLFYLSRQHSITKNWWLYDYQASLLMNDIRHQLAWAQQHLAN